MKNQNYQTAKCQTILQDAFKYFTHPLPLPFPELYKQLSKISQQIYSYQLQQTIITKNKQIIFLHFHQLSELTANVYVYQSLEKKLKQQKILNELQKTVFHDYPHNGKAYGHKIHKIIKHKHMKNNDVRENLQIILRALAKVHYSNFQFEEAGNQMTMTQQKKYQIQVPEKFQNQINNIVFEFFGKLDHNQGSQILEQEAADLLADSLRQIFNDNSPAIKMTSSSILAPQPDDFRKSVRKQYNANQPLFKATFSKFIPTQQKQFKQQPQNQFQDMLNGLIVAVQKSKVGKTTKQQQKMHFKAQIPQFLVEQYQKKKLLNYYQQHTMIHFVNLILNPSVKSHFTISNVKGKPYLKILCDQLIAYKHILKEQFEGLQITFQKSMQKKPMNKPQSVNKKCHKQHSPEVKGIRKNVKKFLVNFLSSHHKQKQQQTFQQPSEEPSEELIRDVLKQYQTSLDLIIKQVQPYTYHYHKLGTSDYEDLRYYHQKQSWIIIVIYIYFKFVIEPERQSKIRYSPTRRRILIKILKQIFDNKRKPKPEFMTWPFILKYLQNNRNQVTIMSNDQVIKKSQIILKELYQNLVNKEYLQTMNQNIFQGGLQNFKESLPMLKLVCLSKGKNAKQSSVRCKVVHLLISGFLSQDSDKHDQWADMVDNMPGCQTYALIWQSDTIKNLVLFLMKTAKDLIIADVMKQQLQKKYQNNPFIPAFQVAKVTGRLLAQLVVRLFPNQFVSLCGYSLGSQVIKQFLARMVSSGHQQMVYNIRVMGGVSDIYELQSIISQSQIPLNLSNCVTKHDGVLKHILSKVKPEIKPMGLYQIPQIRGHFISNVNCNKIISGHLKYRSHMDIMGKILDLSSG